MVALEEKQASGAGLEKAAGEGPEAGADFHHGVALADPAELDNAGGDVLVVEKVLAELTARANAHLREGLADFGERHPAAESGFLRTFDLRPPSSYF